MTAQMTFTNYAAKVAVAQQKLAEAAKELAELHELFWRGAVSWSDPGPPPSPTDHEMTEHQKAILEEIKKAEQVNRARAGRVGMPPSAAEAPPAPGDVPLVVDLNPAALKTIDDVLRANGIPYRRLGDSDFVLTDHVVTDDVKELFTDLLGGSGWSLNGLVAGPLADLRRRPDLFTPKKTIELQKKGEADGFDLDPSHGWPTRKGEAIRVAPDTTVVIPYTPVPKDYGLDRPVYDPRTHEANGDRKTNIPPTFDGSTGTTGGTAKVSVESIPNSGTKE